jgi:hypothetical protein
MLKELAAINDRLRELRGQLQQIMDDVSLPLSQRALASTQIMDQILSAHDEWVGIIRRGEI